VFLTNNFALSALTITELVRSGLAFLIALALSACAMVGLKGPDGGTQSGYSAAENLGSRAIEALRRGDDATARDAAQKLVLADPRSSQAHLLLAASHHLAGDPASLDMALSGYGAARQFAGNSAWAPLLAGMAALLRSQPELAMEQFASAALADPDQYLAFEGLAAAAYASEQLELAQAAAARARTLNANSTIGWRMATLSAAGLGDSPRVKTLLTQAPVLLPAVERQWVVQRSQVLLRTVAIDQQVAQAPGAAQAPTSDPSSKVDLPAVHAPNQLTVDVTLILADDQKTKAFGVNLLDGLQGIFSVARNQTRTSASGGPSSITTTITRAIRIPDITYNLNIFNRGNRYYEVIARPSLTAFTGQQSTFFVGEQLHVQVSGVNTAALEKIDVGVGLKITPNQIREDGAQFNVEAQRSFFSDQGLGSFLQGLATFKQSVTATADVRFGETLILSGLSESATDGVGSRTPVLGDIPGPNVLFSRETQINRSRSVLVLITPSRPAGFARTRTVAPGVQRLIELWDAVIERHHGLPALAERIQRGPKFTRAAAGDIAVRSVGDPQVLAPLLASLAEVSAIPSDIRRSPR